MNISDDYARYAITAGVFLVLFLTAMGIGRIIRAYARRSEIKLKIRASRDSWDSSTPSGQASTGDFFQNLVEKIGKVGARVSGRSEVQYSVLRLKLLRAGIRAQIAQSIFWSAKLLLPVLFCFVFFILNITLLTPMTGQNTIALFVGLAVLGFYAPDIVLMLKARLRREKILLGLPDALDLLLVCVEAGLGLDSAIKRVSQEMQHTNPELSSEFELLNLELRAGKARPDALRALALRTNIDSLNSLVTLIIQTDRFGTSITRALRVFSDSFRNARFQKAEETAAKLPAKMVIPLIFLIFPSFLLIMVGPGAIRIYETFIKMGQ